MVIVYSIIVIAVLGIIFGIGLSIAAQKLARSEEHTSELQSR